MSVSPHPAFGHPLPEGEGDQVGSGLPLPEGEGDQVGSGLPLPRGEGAAKRRVRVRDYLELSKARIVLMVLITTAAGFSFAGGGSVALLFHLLVGTALVAAGTNALNQWAERDLDARMKRTRLRPLPDGRVDPRTAFAFAAAIAVAGTIYLALAVNWLTALLGALTLTSYIFVYTPLKRISPLCTVVGAVPGAIPPLMGWAASAGALGLGGWILFGILFFWQLPHFMAISWIYREDYGRASFMMTSVHDADGSATARQAVLYTLALLPVSVAPTLVGLTGASYLVGSVIAGSVLLAAAIGFQRNRTNSTARRLFMTSNFYLVVMMALLVVA